MRPGSADPARCRRSPRGHLNAVDWVTAPAPPRMPGFSSCTGGWPKSCVAVTTGSAASCGCTPRPASGGSDTLRAPPQCRNRRHRRDAGIRRRTAAIGWVDESRRPRFARVEDFLYMEPRFAYRQPSDPSTIIRLGGILTILNKKRARPKPTFSQSKRLNKSARHRNDLARLDLSDSLPSHVLLAQ